jgi:hypothetical protein
LQGRQANELGPKGAVTVEVANGAVERVDFVELDRVRFAYADIDIATQPDLPGLRKAILGNAPVGSDTVLTITLTGRGPLHRDLRRPGAVEDVLRDVRDELGVASPFVWVDRITDATRPELDREAIRERGDFSADLVRLVDDLRADPKVFADLMDTLALPSRVDSGDFEVGESLLREAEERALDLLESELQR